MNIFPLIVHVSDQFEPHVFTSRFTAGRRDCELVILDDYVTPQHVAFWPDGDGWLISDLGSTNGTWLNGVKIYGPFRLDRGDKIKIGHTIMTVVPAG